MRQYQVRDRAMMMSLCDFHGEPVIELDSRCNLPIINFNSHESAESAARVLNNSDDYPATEFVVAAIEVEE